MYKFNYHGHTARCKHAEKNVLDEQFVLKYIKKGFKEIAFTDHAPEKTKIDPRQRMRMDYSDKQEYLESIEFLKNKYKSKINILSGFEFEYSKNRLEELQELKKESDILLLGQHYIYYPKNNELKIFFWDDKDTNINDDDLFEYANLIKEACEESLPDIIVHPDLFMLSRKKFGKVEEDVSRIICKAAETYHIPLEINLTWAHLNVEKERNEIVYPCKEFWNIAKEYDIEVIYGIDTHYLSQIDDYKDSIKLANKHIGTDTVKKLNFINKINTK